MIELHLNAAALDQLLNDPQGEVGQALRKRGRIMVIKAKAQVGKDTGRLATSIHMVHSRVGVHQQIWVGSRERHALMHHEGTRPHVIVPRDQQLLRFSKNGRMVYSRQVRHPGTKPNKYLSDQLKFAYL